jgi:hypothetical protein
MGLGSRTRTLAIAIAISGLAGVHFAVADEGLRVENPRLDLGEVKAGTTAVATFVFHNDGEKDVNIIRAKPS